MAKRYTTKPGVSLSRLDFWAPADMRDWVDQQATRMGLQRSEYLRKLIIEEINAVAHQNGKVRDELRHAVVLLNKARRFENETVRDHGEMAAWRRALDKFLEGRDGDNPNDRYDTPERVEHRAFIARLIRPAWPVGKGRGKAGIITHRVAARVKRRAEKS